MIGDQRKYVTAIIIPAYEALKEYARAKKISYHSLDDLVKNTEIRAMIADRIERLFRKDLPDLSASRNSLCCQRLSPWKPESSPTL